MASERDPCALQQSLSPRTSSSSRVTDKDVTGSQLRILVDAGFGTSRRPPDRTGRTTTRHQPSTQLSVEGEEPTARQREAQGDYLHGDTDLTQERVLGLLGFCL